jgi:hypothetical protein
MCFVRASIYLAVAIYLAACGGGGGGSGDNATDDVIATNPGTGTTQTSTVGGKLAQSYVRGATVWAEKLVDGVGNYQRDPGEADGISSENGDYQLLGATGDFLLVTSGGKKLDSQGNEVDAAPMMAPAPEAGQASTNITPITTLVVFEPDLKTKLAEYGDWNADIASPSGVNGNLLRIAKIAETLSSAVSGGTSPIVEDLAGNLKSIGALASQLTSTSEDLTDPSVLTGVASSALSTVLSDPDIVQNNLSAEQKASLISSIEQATQGIANAIPASQDVVEDSATLAAVEAVLQEANIDQSIQIKITLGGGSSLKWAPVIREISMVSSGNRLTLTATVDDDDTANLSYAWSAGSDLTISNPQQAEAQMLDFNESEVTVTLQLTDSGGSTDTAACTWQTSTTICTFVE